MTKEEREVQRIIRERAGKERRKGKKVKIEYRKIERNRRKRIGVERGKKDLVEKNF